ncbi:hypothetical protein UFOVP154_53 [uncultured Caudovirales phage]|uniref:Uncharacterized protein n=1 Tax=uncultured Caudovirales phage TaxID=2100421 RepID=A0A6J5KK10_9CAUD|nr:hypothetical protein UFOVP8_38 [uncultured Caudovirales phage]CAB5170860.1 hypothetical protein UFOVP154_53 [uncultured Caudovirales phage]
MILDPLKPYLKLAEWIAAAALVLWAYLHVYHSGYNAAIAERVKADAKDAQIHQQELDKAGHSHDAEIADLSRYVADHPVSVRVCPLGPVQAPAATSPGTSPSAGPVQPVSTGDSSGRDIGPMLSSLASAADRIASELREQQAVK